MHPSDFVLVLHHLVTALHQATTGPTTSPSPGSGGSSPSSKSNYDGLILIVAVFAVVYFLFIRPQRNRNKAAAQTRTEIEPGVEILTRHGQYATVVSVDDDSLTLEIAPGVHSRFVKEAIARVITPEPEPALETADNDLDGEGSSLGPGALSPDAPAIESIPEMSEHPDDTGPSDTAPSDTAPSDTAPSDTAPSDTAPSDTAPGETAQQPDDDGGDH